MYEEFTYLQKKEQKKWPSRVAFLGSNGSRRHVKPWVAKILQRI